MIGKEIIEIESIDSTNLYLNNLIKKVDLENGTVVFADEQTNGRGQVNNTWESAKGENILMSFIVYPDFLDAGNQFMLSKFVSLGIFGFLKNYLEDVKIKWPNDIYVGDKKIAGVLIENSLRGTTITNSIIGIGLNINQVEFNQTIPNPTSLKLEANNSFDRLKLLKELCESLNKWYQELILKNDEKLNSCYLKALYNFEIMAKYQDEAGRFKARITSVDENGRLCMVDSNKNHRKYAFKEVEFLRNSV